MSPHSGDGGVNLSAPRSFGKRFKSDLKETFLADDPFGQFKNSPPLVRAKKALQYFVPIFQWLPKYDFRKFRYDLLAGITITSLAIPQGISYAKLGSVPPIIGLYSSFVPPLIYAVFGSSKHIAIGTVAASSLLIVETISEKVSPTEDPTLYLHLVFSAAFVTGVFELILGFLRLGFLVDFLSHSTITGFMGGTAIIICLQQLKGIFGMKHFTTHTDVISVLRVIIDNKNEVQWRCTLVGACFLVFLLFTRYTSKKKPKLFWVSAMAPMATVVVGCLFAYFADVEKYGIQTVGPLKKGINPPSLKDLNFSSEYLGVVLKAGIVTGVIAMSEGIAIGRSFALMENDQTDGNKEMIAFGLMNIVGSFTSCYLTTGPFSKSAVNYNAGCKTAMSNIVMSGCMMLVLLFLAPLFSYTPLVALSAIIIVAMLGLIKYDEVYYLFKVDKFDFLISITAFFGVAFINMEIGLMLSVALSIIRALLYMARPATCKLGNMPNSKLYRDVEQYPGASDIPGVLFIKLGSPIYFANSTYVRERIMRWVRDEEAKLDGGFIEHMLLDLEGVTSIDHTGIETLLEIRRMLDAKNIKLGIINPRIEVTEKMMFSSFINIIGKKHIYLSIEAALESCRFSLHKSKEKQTSDSSDSMSSATSS